MSTYDADGNTVVGTWNFVKAWNVDGQGNVTYPWGNPASGYWSFDEAGWAGVQISVNPPPPMDANFPGDATLAQLQEALSGQYMAYFGTYTFDAQNITIQVFSDVLRQYTGTAQVRPYVLSADGNTLTIGDGQTYWRVLTRLT